MKKFVLITLLLFLSCIQANAEDKESQVSKMVRQYVESQMTCAAEPYFVDFIRFSSKQKKEEYLNHRVIEAEMYDFRTDPVAIVSNFQIINVFTNSDRGTAIVEYTHVASTTGRNNTRRIFEDFKPQNRITYNLSFYKGKWWVIDPPIPRFSLDYMLNEYESLLNRLYTPKNDFEVKLQSLEPKMKKKVESKYRQNLQEYELLKSLKQKYGLITGSTGRNQ